MNLLSLRNSLQIFFYFSKDIYVPIRFLCLFKLNELHNSFELRYSTHERIALLPTARLTYCRIRRHRIGTSPATTFQVTLLAARIQTQLSDDRSASTDSVSSTCCLDPIWDGEKTRS